MRIFVVLLLSLVAALTPGRANAQGDWSGVDAFWRIHDVLVAGAEPTAAQWTALFATPGYALLEERERRGAALRRAFRLAYKPSLRDSLEAEGRTTSWIAMVLPHLAEVSRQRTAIDAFFQQVTATKTLDSGAVLAQAWLPAGTTANLAAPEVSWAVFRDARGYPRIVLDPLYVMRHGAAHELLGHELHHNYRNRIARPMKSFGSDLLPWALVNVEVEGIAGLVDKRPAIELDDAGLRKRYPDGSSGAEYFRAYPKVYADSPRWLRFADSMLVVIAATPDSAQRAAKGRHLHGALPDNGRAMGSWMSEAILATLGRERLLSVVGDAFGFWLAYDEAARRAPSQYPTLSPAALAVIREVRSKYAIP
ncbi:MAG: hypothetical protein H7066_13745 [Cytophagaceae bacterium]|nr:hypothetical protein [Gemmatimonadaceae bacterium]